MEEMESDWETRQILRFLSHLDACDWWVDESLEAWRVTRLRARLQVSHHHNHPCAGCHAPEIAPEQPYSSSCSSSDLFQQRQVCVAPRVVLRCPVRGHEAWCEIVIVSRTPDCGHDQPSSLCRLALTFEPCASYWESQIVSFHNGHCLPKDTHASNPC
jgi:hypothetical protein